MAYVYNDGPPDLDATHAWAPETGGAPPTINNRATDPATLPWIKLDGIQGWRSLPEADDNRAPRTATDGEQPYPGRRLGKTLVYECRVLAKTRSDVRQKLNLTLQGYGRSFSDEGVMTVTPYTVPGGIVWTFSARVIDLQADRSFTYSDRRRASFQWGFTISLRMSDPLFYTAGQDPCL